MEHICGLCPYQLGRPNLSTGSTVGPFLFSPGLGDQDENIEKMVHFSHSNHHNLMVDFTLFVFEPLSYHVLSHHVSATFVSTAMSHQFGS